MNQTNNAKISVHKTAHQNFLSHRNQLIDFQTRVVDWYLNQYWYLR